jgi:hypothetical protein
VKRASLIGLMAECWKLWASGIPIKTSKHGIVTFGAEGADEQEG